MKVDATNIASIRPIIPSRVSCDYSQKAWSSASSMSSSVENPSCFSSLVSTCLNFFRFLYDWVRGIFCSRSTVESGQPPARSVESQSGQVFEEPAVSAPQVSPQAPPEDPVVTKNRKILDGLFAPSFPPEEENREEQSMKSIRYRFNPNDPEAPVSPWNEAMRKEGDLDLKGSYQVLLAIRFHSGITLEENGEKASVNMIFEEGQGDISYILVSIKDGKLQREDLEKQLVCFKTPIKSMCAYFVQQAPPSFWGWKVFERMAFFSDHPVIRHAFITFPKGNELSWGQVGFHLNSKGPKAFSFLKALTGVS